MILFTKEKILQDFFLNKNILYRSGNRFVNLDDILERENVLDYLANHTKESLSIDSIQKLNILVNKWSSHKTFYVTSIFSYDDSSDKDSWCKLDGLLLPDEYNKQLYFQRDVDQLLRIGLIWDLKIKRI